MTPEQLAREEIDEQLEACGWVVQDFTSMNIHAGLGVAVREFPLKWKEGAEIKSGSADYLLYADEWAIGVVEAKPAGHTLEGVVVQSKRYTEGLDEWVPARYRPLPFAYESTGEVTQFTNGLDPHPRSREIFTFHRPQELLRQQDLGSAQLRRTLRQMPGLPQGKLWPVQHEAIRNLEQSLAHGRLRALIQMATGSGKTFTAVSACHRLIKHAKAKRILFLVDRNNLGRQTLNEFQQFRDPASAYTFADEFPVQHLRGNAIEPASKVVITTIQRLYSILKGDPEYDPANEEESLFESGRPPGSDPVPVEYTPDVPVETFDFIVIDECHRSIYNVWRQVIEYFDAFLIGLTATPSLHTIGFFNNNVVQDYSHTKAVADGVNVGYDIYRIRTKISEAGGSVEAGRYVPRRDRRTRKTTLAELEDDLTYTATQLDRDVVAPDQIRLVVRTFRERLFTEIFPGRTEVPKTLVFAKMDSHADLMSSLASRLARLGRQVDETQAARIANEAGGKTLAGLTGALLTSIDPQLTHDAAVEKYGLNEDEDPTPQQLNKVERDRMAEALRPFTRPGLRRAIVEIAQSVYQIIDEAALDVLLDFGHSEAAVASARSKLDDFQRFLEDNRDRIEALRILYSRPYRAGLRYRHVKELRDALRNPPVALHKPENGLWRLYEALEPERVKGRGGGALVDLVAIVKHALRPDERLVPVADQVEARYREWLAEKEHIGQTFTAAQRKWLDAIKDHIASSLSIERDDFEDVPFNRWGGLGGVYRVFGEDLDPLLDELNERLAA